MDHAHMDHMGPMDHMDHAQMPHGHQTPKPSKTKKRKPAAGHAASHANMPPMDHAAMDHGAMHAGHEMKGLFGPYGMSREGSGTSWQPDTSPHEGIHAQYGEWMTMWHAMFNGVYDNQGGPRGDSKTFVSGMVMAMAERQVDAGTFGLRAMLSPDPLMGANGYPLLLGSGETADGRTPLIDRQHPHDLFMEMAATYSYQIAKASSVFRLCGTARRSGARSIGVHAPRQRSRYSGSTNHPSLARQHAHYLRRRHRGRRAGHGQARSLGLPRARAGSVSVRHRAAEARQLLGPRQLESDAGAIDAGVVGTSHVAGTADAGGQRKSPHGLGFLYQAVQWRRRVGDNAGLGPQVQYAGQYAGRLSRRKRADLQKRRHVVSRAPNAFKTTNYWKQPR